MTDVIGRHKGMLMEGTWDQALQTSLGPVFPKLGPMELLLPGRCTCVFRNKGVWGQMRLTHNRY